MCLGSILPAIYSEQACHETKSSSLEKHLPTFWHIFIRRNMIVSVRKNCGEILFEPCTLEPRTCTTRTRVRPKTHWAASCHNCHAFVVVPWSAPAFWQKILKFLAGSSLMLDTGGCSDMIQSRQLPIHTHDPPHVAHTVNNVVNGIVVCSSTIMGMHPAFTL